MGEFQLTTRLGWTWNLCSHSI